ncbi:MAG: zinc ribbon domain-containing protein [Ruminococcus sp.]|nr:zinc ribbon domain-containing protein [Ruminococcus sp.]
MSKFCTKCGATLEDNAAFCTTCGAKFETAPAAEANADNTTLLEKFKANANAEGIKKLQANPNFTKYVGIGVVVIAAIIIICIIASVLGNGWKKPLNNYFKAIEEKDGEILMSVYHEYDLKYEKKEVYDKSEKDMKKAYKERVKNYYDFLDEGLEYGGDLKLSVKIDDADELDEDDLKDWEKELEKSWDKKRLEVTKGYEVDGVIKVKGDDDKGEEEFEAYVVKVDGDWCLVGIEWFDSDDYYDYIYNTED